VKVAETLAACRTEYERQKSIEDNAEIPEWALDGYRLVNSAGATIAELERTGSESTYMMLPMSRNLNPARLKVAKRLLDAFEEWYEEALNVAPEEESTFDVTEIADAAALLGIEVVE
jgi:hypothetical protein